MPAQIRILSRSFKRSLKSAGFADGVSLKAKALNQLQSNLFRFPWVEAIEFHGLANSPGRSQLETTVFILTSEPITGTMKNQAESILGHINIRFGLNIKMLIVHLDLFVNDHSHIVAG